MKFQQKLYSMLIGLLISSSVAPAGIAPVSGSLSSYAAPYGAKAMPAWSNSGVGSQGIPNPQATLNPEFLRSVQSEKMDSQYQTPWMNQKIVAHPLLMNYSSQQIPHKKFEQAKQTPKTKLHSPRNTQEAAAILNVSQNATEKEILAAYRKAALKAHPDLGGSNEEMKIVNEAKNLLQANAKYAQGKSQTGSQKTTHETSSRTQAKQQSNTSSKTSSKASNFTRGGKIGAGAIVGSGVAAGLEKYRQNKFEAEIANSLKRQALRQEFEEELDQEIDEYLMREAIQEEIQEQKRIEQMEKDLMLQVKPRSFYKTNKKLWMPESELAQYFNAYHG